ncbi:hypothetical protein LTR53_010540 [Teratosphaeriaceae sp. CCFEE 6253]|nr:hypothetical protein LTR53_010540 [Teratosphaeriaceae sp. CCFEE 6253]
MVEYTIYPSLRGKTVLITGGAEGIGAAAVELFCRQGSKVILFDISEPSAVDLIDKVRQEASTNTVEQSWRPTIAPPIFYQCDVTDLDQLSALARQVLDEHGPVHVLVNNAAAAGSKSRVPSTEMTPEIWDLDVATNLRHVMFLTQYIVPSMQKMGTGSIINMGSIVRFSSLGDFVPLPWIWSQLLHRMPCDQTNRSTQSWRIPAVGLPVYTMCKAAIMGLTRTHSKEFGKDGIRVNSIMPGAIATERQRKEVLTAEYRAEVMAAQSLQRDLLPEEVARVILFLASDDSSAVTGSSYVVDGGWVSDP